ncbi:MAG: hypothetical protein WCF93_01065 [Candidatus Moraniibacteriota bacterium]
MKSLIQFANVCVLLFTFAGCSNHQNSSKEETLFLIEHQPDFQETIQYLSFESRAIGFMHLLFVHESMPPLKKKDELIIHEVIYKTNTGSFKMVLLNDTRPVKIIATKEFK